MSVNLASLNKVSKFKKIRVGRGIGSGKGKTSGRGVKGQKARTGHHSVKGFEGGQTPIYMRLPKKGFKSLKKDDVQAINIKDILSFIKSNKISKGDVINNDLLFKVGLLKNKNSKVKLILSGISEIDKSVSNKIEVDFYSESAKSILSL